MRFFFLINILFMFIVSPAFSEFKNTSRGEVTLESRIFEGDGDSNTEDYGYGVFSQLQTKLEYDSFSSVLRINGRVDRVDSDRNQLNVEEAWIGYSKSIVNITAGYQMFNWSAAEAFHPADILNSRNFDSNIENPDKLGELALTINFFLFSGELTFYYMPYYQKPIMPGEHSRLNAMASIPDTIHQKKNSYIDHDGKLSNDMFGHQGAIRLMQNFSELDISLHVVYHLERNLMLPAYDVNDNSLSMLFQRKIQYGGTVQYALGPSILRSEFAYRNYLGFDKSVKEKYQDLSTGEPLENTVDHAIVSLGIDYEFDIGRIGDGTFFFEGQRIFGTSQEEREAIDIFQSDIMFGFNFAMDDIYNRTFSISGIIDTERPSQVLLNMFYRQRINDVWAISLSARRIIAQNNDSTVTGLEALDDANLYSVKLSRYY